MGTGLTCRDVTSVTMHYGCYTKLYTDVAIAPDQANQHMRKTDTTIAPDQDNQHMRKAGLGVSSWNLGEN